MSPVIQGRSWQGSPLRAPVASLRLWLSLGVEPISEPVDRIADQSLAGDFALPAPIDLKGVPAPQDPRPLHGDDFIESKERSCPYAIQTRKGAVALPFLGTIPSTMAVSRPWNPDQPCEVWIPPSCQSWIMTM